MLQSFDSKLPSFGIYPSLCDLLSNFLSGRSIATVVDCHRSSLNLLIVVFLRVLSYPQHFFYFSLMTFFLILHHLSTPKLIIPLFITTFSLRDALLTAAI